MLEEVLNFWWERYHTWQLGQKGTWQSNEVLLKISQPFPQSRSTRAIGFFRGKKKEPDLPVCLTFLGCQANMYGTSAHGLDSSKLGLVEGTGGNVNLCSFRMSVSTTEK